MRSLTDMSRLIALVLRHKPQTLGLTLDEHGWCSTAALVEKLNAIQPFTMDTLALIVARDSKQRYSFNEDRTLIRANQGHSVQIDAELPEAIPETMLYHGTSVKAVESILESGLEPRGRLYVHLSGDEKTARRVGARHGFPVVFLVDAPRMVQDGYRFFRSVNGVWLTGTVPPQYLTRLKG